MQDSADSGPLPRPAPQPLQKRERTEQPHSPATAQPWRPTRVRSHGEILTCWALRIREWVNNSDSASPDADLIFSPDLTEKSAMLDCPESGAMAINRELRACDDLLRVFRETHDDDDWVQLIRRADALFRIVEKVAARPQSDPAGKIDSGQPGPDGTKPAEDVQTDADDFEFVDSDYAEPILKSGLAILFGVNQKTITRWIKSGELRAMPGTSQRAKKVRIHGDDFPDGSKRPHERKQKLSALTKPGKRQ